jgi:hypothetical protein
MEGEARMKRLTHAGIRPAVLMLVLVILALYSTPTRAATRLQAYTVRCIGSPLGKVTHTLKGHIVTANRDIVFQASCDPAVNNGYSQDVFPAVTWDDGEVLSISVALYVTIYPKDGSPKIANICGAYTYNGYMQAKCNASSSYAASLQAQITIAE